MRTDYFFQYNLEHGTEDKELTAFVKKTFEESTGLKWENVMKSSKSDIEKWGKFIEKLKDVEKMYVLDYIVDEFFDLGISGGINDYFEQTLGTPELLRIGRAIVKIINKKHKHKNVGVIKVTKGIPYVIVPDYYYDKNGPSKNFTSKETLKWVEDFKN